MEDDAATARNINHLLTSPVRKRVDHSFSMHSMVSVDAGVRLHLVLKFKYHESVLPLFGAAIPLDAVIKRYGSGHRLFPYCIFNSVEETPISWTYQNTDGKVYERIELFATVCSVVYARYYPFVLKLLNLKVGTDGTAKTGLINLVPELKPGTEEPNVDFGIFTKRTSEYRIAKNGIQSGDVICRMVVRDLTDDTLGNLSGIYSRVYTIFFFESQWRENLVNFVVLPTMLLHTSAFLPRCELADGITVAMAVVFTNVALLLVMPKTEEYSTAERVVLVQTLYVLVALFARGFLGTHCESEAEVCVASWAIFGGDCLVTVICLLMVLHEYRSYRSLVEQIKTKFRSVHAYVGIFKDIDEEI